MALSRFLWLQTERGGDLIYLFPRPQISQLYLCVCLQPGAWCEIQRANPNSQQRGRGVWGWGGGGDVEERETNAPNLCSCTSLLYLRSPVIESLVVNPSLSLSLFCFGVPERRTGPAHCPIRAAVGRLAPRPALIGSIGDYFNQKPFFPRCPCPRRL